MEWLHKNIFETPEWLLDTSVLQNIDHTAYFENVRRVQSSQLNQLMGLETLGRLINSETTQDDNYSAYEMLSDLRKGLWNEAYRSRNVELYRRNLQNTYLDYMADLLTDNDASNYNVETSDVRTLVRGETDYAKKDPEQGQKHKRKYDDEVSLRKCHRQNR